MGRTALRRRVGTEGHHTEDRPDIMGKALLVCKVGESRVFIRPPERGSVGFYRVWSEASDYMNAIGRLYPNGKFDALKTQTAMKITITPGWGKALREMKGAMTVHRVMSE